MRRLWRIGVGQVAEQRRHLARATSGGARRSARSRRPAASSVVPCRMQVRTSSSGAAVGRGVADVVGGDDGHAVRGGEVGEAAGERSPSRSRWRCTSTASRSREDAARGDRDAVAASAPASGPSSPPARQKSPAACSSICAQRSRRVALRPPERAGGEEPAEVPVAARDPRPAARASPASATVASAPTSARTPARRAAGEEARRAGDAAPVGERERVVAERGGALDEILGERGAARGS